MPTAHRLALAALFVALTVAPALAAPPQRSPLQEAGQQTGQQQQAQQQQEPEHPPLPPLPPELLARGGAFTASVEMVRVPVVVIDVGGEFVAALSPADFTVKDAGRLYAVEHFIADTAPSAVVVVVDATREMVDRVEDVRRAIARIYDELAAGDELALIGYAAEVETLVPLTHDRAEIIAGLERYDVGADRSERRLYDGVSSALGVLAGATHEKRSVIVIGSGTDRGSRIGEIDLERQLHEAGVTVHAIDLQQTVPGSRGGEERINRIQTLPEMVRFTGGLLARRPAAAERFGGIGAWLEIAGTDISCYVNHQYLLHYTPLDPPRSGTWRAIGVKVAGGFDRVRARSGYVR